jgi:DNA-binding GntR family transcriptional regulator
MLPPATRVTISSTKRTAKSERGTSVDVAFQRVRDLIVHGKLAPGTWIVEGDLCDHLNMSRTPVRGALYLLQREGYIIEYRNGGRSRMIVAPLTKEDANELYLIIGHLEGLAGRRAAALTQSERNELTGELEEVNENLAQIARGRGCNGPDIFDLDHKFHRLLLTAGAGPRLSALHRAIEPQTERYWRHYASPIINDLHVSVTEHEEIIAALLKGDPDRMERGLTTNWENGCNRLARNSQYLIRASASNVFPSPTPSARSSCYDEGYC